MEDIKRSIAEFLERMGKKGWPAVELRVRVGESSELVDQYALAEVTPDLIHRDMVTNAQGVVDPVSSFFLRALGNENKKGPARSFSVINEEPAHQGDRFDASDKATIRMLMEHAHRSHLIINNTLAQVTAIAQASLQSQTSIQSQMAETHSEAIATLREARANQARVEVQLLEANAKAERSGKLMDVGMQMLPALIAQLTSGKDDAA